MDKSNNFSNAILDAMNSFPSFFEVTEAINKKNGAASIFGLSDEAAKQHTIASLCKNIDGNILIVLPTEAECLMLFERLFEYGIECIHFPAKLQILGNGSVSRDTELKRIEILVKLLKNNRSIVLTTTEALMQSIAPVNVINQAVINVSLGESILFEELSKQLVSSGYKRSEVCDDKGIFAVRGGRIDVFPCNMKNPVRIEFFGDEIDSVRLFDVDTQRSIKEIDSLEIYPATELPMTSEQSDLIISTLSRSRQTRQLAEELSKGIRLNRLVRYIPLAYEKTATLLDYISQKESPAVILSEPRRLYEGAEADYNIFIQQARSILEAEGKNDCIWQLFKSAGDLFKSFDELKVIMLSALTAPFNHISPKIVSNIKAIAPDSFHGDFYELKQEIKGYIEHEYATVIYAGKSAVPLKNVFEDDKSINQDKVILCSKLDADDKIKKGQVTILSSSLSKGFVYPELKLLVLTETEIYSKQMYKQNKFVSKVEKTSERIDISKYEKGDLVVHKQYGIARFAGIERRTAVGIAADYAILDFEDSQLCVPCDKIENIHKYLGTGSPKLSKLNDSGKSWEKKVSKARTSVKKLAFDLAALYGERAQIKGYAFSPDSPSQIQLESSFPYNETPDQLMSIKEIKADMESDRIMDRMLCGDVGFGKTEVALRAAFKAVMDCKQVAILVPTTVLAFQHYNTVKERFAPFDVNVEFLSSFKSQKERKDIIKRLSLGEIDVIIGTTSLLSKEVSFFDLGLLIIDEEQRFGVGDKEKIKTLKANVDVLTLTATPIPRTLHMSIVGIRDMSVLDTPPEMRFPVQTFVCEFDDNIVRDAIIKELNRQGQVYVLYNNVEDMPYFADKLKKLVPEAENDIRCANGQMPKQLLEKCMLDFIEHKFSILITSTIIENGLDVPNANTIIVCDADKLGLAQMYQLKGRVGRSKKQAYAYFTYRKNMVLSQVAADRLSAITQYTELGSGYKVAMRDLQIRGAGELLGASQSGHMEQIGYELYSELVKEAVDEARGYVYAKRTDTLIEQPPFTSYLPKSYIEKEDVRTSIYVKIAKIRSVAEAEDCIEELIDRYGTDEDGNLPKPLMNLINVATLKAVASECHIKKLAIRPETVEFTLQSSAPYSPELLLSFCKGIGACLTPNGDVYSISVPERDIDKPRVCKKLIKDIIPTLKKCMND